MNDLKPLICPQCGGQVDRARLICKSCGTQFKEDKVEPLKFVCVRPGVHVLQASREVGREIYDVMGEQKASEYILKSMAKELTEHIIPYMDVRTEYIPYRNTTAVCSRIRILDATYEF